MRRTGTAIEHGIKTSLRSLRRGRAAGIRSRRVRTVTGFTTALVLAATLASPVGPAQALKYPTWEDLQKAKSNTSAAAGQVAEIKGLIAGLRGQVAQTQAESDARGAELLSDGGLDAGQAASLAPEVVPSPGAVGGGGAPGLELAGWAVTLPQAFAVALRRHDPCVVCRVERGRTFVDLRCIPESADDAVLEAIRSVALQRDPG